VAHARRRISCCLLVFAGIAASSCSSESEAQPDWWADGGSQSNEAGEASGDVDGTQDAGDEDRQDTGAVDTGAQDSPPDVVAGDEYDVVEAGDEYLCDPTNGGIELCDGLDNDCNGEVDESFNLTTDPKHCGTCETDCSFSVQGAMAVTCTATPGAPGACGYASCAPDYWDADGEASNGCEYYCVQKTSADETCDFVDDDCDGEVDEDVDLCSSAVNCGKCGHSCQGKLHAVGACEPTNPTATDCDELNTKCVIGSCEPGYVDANDMFLDGCEYECTPTQRTDPGDPSSLVPCDVTDPTCGAVEYCDGIDNDCDGPVDEGC
jgi:Putative metal-binding motif